MGSKHQYNLDCVDAQIDSACDGVIRGVFLIGFLIIAFISCIVALVVVSLDFSRRFMHVALWFMADVLAAFAEQQRRRARQAGKSFALAS